MSIVLMPWLATAPDDFRSHCAAIDRMDGKRGDALCRPEAPLSQFRLGIVSNPNTDFVRALKGAEFGTAPGVSLLDVEALAATVGTAMWYDRTQHPRLNARA